jgi:hypothetical protein
MRASARDASSCGASRTGRDRRAYSRATAARRSKRLSGSDVDENPFSPELGRGLAVWQLPVRPREVAGFAVPVALEIAWSSASASQKRLASLISVTTCRARGLRRRRLRSCPRRPGAARRSCRRSRSGRRSRSPRPDGPWSSGRGSGRRTPGRPGRRCARGRRRSRPPRRDPRVLVGRVVVLPTGVSDPCGDDSVAVAQQLLYAPEAASRADRGLGVVAHRVVPPPKCCWRRVLEGLWIREDHCGPGEQTSISSAGHQQVDYLRRNCRLPWRRASPSPPNRDGSAVRALTEEGMAGSRVRCGRPRGRSAQVAAAVVPLPQPARKLGP